MKKYSNTVTVGIFVIICLLGLLYLSVGTGKFHITSPGYNLYALFNDVAGLSVNGPVMLNGMEVGRVQEMKIYYEGDKAKVKLKLLIRPEIKIADDPVLSIKTLGFMGEKYVHILTRQKTEGFLSPGIVLEGKNPVDMDAIFSEAEVISRNLNVLIEQTNKLAKNLTDISGQVNTSLANNKESIDQIIKNLEGTSRNFEGLSADLRAHPWKLLFKGKEKK